MKSNYLTFLLTLLILSCESLHQNISSLSGCCHLPVFVDDSVERSCIKECKSNGDHCVAECYVTKTRMVVNGTVDYSKVSKMYGITIPRKFRFGFCIFDALKSCKLRVEGDLNQNLLKYFNCINELYIKNCSSPINTPECRKKVFAAKLNCLEKHSWVSCCKNLPEVWEFLGPRDMSYLADHDCSLEFSNEARKRCFGDTLKSVEDESLKLKNEVLMKIVKNNLDGLSEFFKNYTQLSKKWHDVIDTTVKACLSQNRGLIWTISGFNFFKYFQYF